MDYNTLNKERKLLVLRMHYGGANMRDVSVAAEVSRQTVCNYLRKTPGKVSSEAIIKPDLPEEKVDELFRLYVDNDKTITVPALAEATGLTEDEVTRVFAYNKQGKRKIGTSSLHPAITEWINAHGCGAKGLAKAMGVAPDTLYAVIHGTTDLGPPLAYRISKVTGLSMEAMYTDSNGNIDTKAVGRAQAFFLKMQSTETEDDAISEDEEMEAE